MKSQKRMDGLNNEQGTGNDELRIRMTNDE
jgi:hypothetical protein